MPSVTAPIGVEMAKAKGIPVAVAAVEQIEKVLGLRKPCWWVLKSLNGVQSALWKGVSDVASYQAEALYVVSKAPCNL